MLAWPQPPCFFVGENRLHVVLPPAHSTCQCICSTGRRTLFLFTLVGAGLLRVGHLAAVMTGLPYFCFVGCCWGRGSSVKGQYVLGTLSLPAVFFFFKLVLHKNL